MIKFITTSILIKHKNNSLQPKTVERVNKNAIFENSNLENDYISNLNKYSPQNKLNKGRAPTLFGIDKKQKFNRHNEEKQSRITKINNTNHRSIKHPPFLDNISINSPDVYNCFRANTTKYTASKRVKSNESKQSQSSQNNETTTKTNDLTQFFERRININDHFRK